MVEKRVTQDASNRQFWIFFDRIVTQVFIATISIEKIFPIGITFPNPATEREAHGGRLNIQGFVVFDHPNGFGYIKILTAHVDGFEKHIEINGLQKVARLTQVFAALLHTKRERFQTLRRLSTLQQSVIEQQ